LPSSLPAAPARRRNLLRQLQLSTSRTAHALLVVQLLRKLVKQFDGLLGFTFFQQCTNGE
jgi:hypothetical protein